MECQASGNVPGDCGEGIHLMSVTDSTVSHDYVTKNSGGILLTDEFGPTDGNVIEHNLVTNNASDSASRCPPTMALPSTRPRSRPIPRSAGSTTTPSAATS